VARITQEIKKTNNKVIIINDSNFLIRKKAVGNVALKALNYLEYTHIYLDLIFTSDSKIKRMNGRFLSHNWPTDVLAFPSGNIKSSQKIKLLGEVIISPKRALLQAPLYQASFQEELARYICHGILHLAGFKDKTKRQKSEMRKKENKILSLSKPYINRIV